MRIQVEVVDHQAALLARFQNQRHIRCRSALRVEAAEHQFGHRDAEQPGHARLIGALRNGSLFHFPLLYGTAADLKCVGELFLRHAQPAAAVQDQLIGAHGCMTVAVNVQVKVEIKRAGAKESEPADLKKIAALLREALMALRPEPGEPASC